MRATEGEFICPDTFGRLVALPIAPTVFLYLGQPDATISKEEVARRNIFAQQCAIKYSFACDFVACPV